MQEKADFNWSLIGHEKIKEFLQSEVKQRRLAHAYLFSGPEKIGKTTLARLFAKTVSCDSFHAYSKLNNYLSGENELSVLPCGVCESCLQFDKGIYHDFYQIEREVNQKTGERRQAITINQIRELQNKLNKRSFSNSYKVAIIKEAEALNKEAANALLKTLEEPSPKTILILITTTRELILETIQSRCQSLKFSSVTKKEIREYLVRQGMSRTQADEIACLSQGRPTVALNALKNKDLMPGFQAQVEWWIQLLGSNNVQKLKLAEKLLQSKLSVENLLKELSTFSMVLRDILLARAGQLDLITFRSLSLKGQSVLPQLVDSAVVTLLKNIEHAKVQLKQNINIRLVLENLFLNI